jgi:hypothetical protein
MQRRDDFQKQYVHKQAGMETTIVMGCVPRAAASPSEAGSGPLVMRVRRLAEGAEPAEDGAGVVPVAHFAVDGVILGDGRTWTEVRFDRLDGIGAGDLVGGDGVEDEVLVVITPQIDQLLATVADAGA